MTLFKRAKSTLKGQKNDFQRPPYCVSVSESSRQLFCTYYENSPKRKHNGVVIENRYIVTIVIIETTILICRLNFEFSIFQVSFLSIFTDNGYSTSKGVRGL